MKIKGDAVKMFRLERRICDPDLTIWCYAAIVLPGLDLLGAVPAHWAGAGMVATLSPDISRGYQRSSAYFRVWLPLHHELAFSSPSREIRVLGLTVLPCLSYGLGLVQWAIQLYAAATLGECRRDTVQRPEELACHGV